MAAVDIGSRSGPPVAVGDDLDNLFNYGAGDVFQDVDTNMDVPAQQKPALRADKKETMPGLGIDEEIKVIKKRAPVPKLDENRLLGSAGISKLRKITKERLKYKGKGNEYSDLARLLNVYQLWLDELYPRAKFVDGLAMIEKLGHTKRMQTMRREWINEGKLKGGFESEDRTSQDTLLQQPNVPPLKHRPTMTGSEMSPQIHAASNDKEDIQPATTLSRKGRSSGRAVPPTESLFVSDDEDLGVQPSEDDLDALLGEDQAKQASTIPTTLREPRSLDREDNFDDEMEAMAGIHGMW